MDNMLEHPGIELQLLIKEKGLTQKAFASILGKKVSEVNELLKGKRNITIQRDYILHKTLGTPIKYRILKQVDYDYSLIDIDEKPVSSGAIAKDLRGETDSSPDNGNGQAEEINTQDSSSQAPQNDNNNELSGAIANDPNSSPLPTEESQCEIKPQKNLNQKPNPKDDEDHQKRAKIFKSF